MNLFNKVMMQIYNLLLVKADNASNSRAVELNYILIGAREKFQERLSYFYYQSSQFKITSL